MSGARASWPPAAPRFAGLLGSDVSSSLSPRLHGDWFDEIGMPGAYVLLEADTEDRALALLRALTSVPGFLGLNITLPYKTSFLSEADFTPSERVARVGGANTLHRLPGGGWGLENTDVDGIIASLEALPIGASGSVATGTSATETGSVDPAREWDVVCLGAGGAARAVPEALRGLGVRSLLFACRSPESAAFPAGAQGPSGGEPSAGEPAIGFVTLKEAIERGASAPESPGLLVVNALPLGAEGGAAPENPWARDVLVAAAARRPPGSVCYFDMLYLPSHGLSVARGLGVPCVGGALMLQEQGRAAFRLWTGSLPSRDPLTPRRARKPG